MLLIPSLGIILACPYSVQRPQTTLAAGLKLVLLTWPLSLMLLVRYMRFAKSGDRIVPFLKQFPREK